MSEHPLVIAHRGASGYRPEHTLASYRLAIALGADHVELDLVTTRDGVLVARHEHELSRSTDVAERSEFAGRLTTRLVDGREATGWFSEDFTLAELKTLRAVERRPELRPLNTRYDRRYDVPTLDEVLALVVEESRRLGRRVGVCAEIKHAMHFASMGLPVDEPLLAALAGHTLPVHVMAFEQGFLRSLRERTSLPLVQLIGATGRVDLVTDTGLRRVEQYADAVGLEKDLVSADLVAAAHRTGLEVFVWTLRDEVESIEDTQAYVDAGVDGLITDHPDTTLEALRLRASGMVPPHASGIRIHATT
ncbi:glycerophosphodiester phosphodiesterase family protein [Nocardioides sp. SR21]|uniref:glycerophosphodiester phosphodiesterase family protein n=1 Tax=Nocardioides sp. SR21 TaxID=2919501 RepID=UPI001FA97AB0|nr:glycerophosphodiester phosphodiesterase family protein [Nocardioides sp. SR21]